MTILANPASAQDYTTGLVGHWEMNETAGTNVPDSSPSGFDGTFVNTPIWQPTGGYIDGALEFVPASATGVSLPNGSFASLTTGTIAAWINWDGTAGVQQIFLQGGSPQWFEFYVNGGRIEIWSNATCSPRVVGRSGAGTIVAGTWHHVAYATNGSGNTFYIDGAPISATYTVGNATTNSFFNHCGAGAGTGYRIGRATSATEYFDGEIDEVRVYNRRLSNADIAALYAYTGNDLPCNAAHAGVMLYNEDESVMQYCNSTDWIDMGPKGAYNSSAPTAGLVQHWALNEASGTTAADSSGSAQPGTLFNGTAWQVGGGHLGNALLLDGVNDCIRNDNIDLSATNDITVSMWVNRTWTPGAVTALFEGTNNFNSATTGYVVAWSDNPTCGNGEISTGLRGNTGNYNIACYTPPSSAAWHLLTFVYDTGQAASGETNFYIDGVLQTPTARPISFDTAGNFGNDSFNLGGRNCSGAPTLPTDGTYDEVRIYNRALSGPEIVDLYNHTAITATTCSNPDGVAGEVDYNYVHAVMQYCNGSHWINMGPIVEDSAPSGGAMPSTGLIGYWSFDETSGTTAADTSGNNNNGTLTNMDGSTDWVAGRVNGGLDFDGSNDVVVVPDNNSLDLAAPVTISFWLYARSLSKSYNTFVGKWGGPHNYSPYANASRVLCIYNSGGTCSSYTIPLNQWVHITTVMTATNNTDIYINGAYHSSVARGTGSANGANMGIGNAPGYSEVIDGIMDEVRLYNAALTAQEVQRLYLGAADPVTPTGCPTIGDECSDGTVYAGLSPDGNVKMYTTHCDVGQTWDGSTCTGARTGMAWNNGNVAGYVTTNVTNVNTGAANTATLAAMDADSVTGGTQPHLQAQYCANLNSDGHEDWYLPARAEQDILYANRTAIGNFDTTSVFATTSYMNSTEDDANAVYYRDFKTGSNVSTNKEYTSHSLRCTRKGAGAMLGSCSAPPGIAGEMVYNADHDIMQYCNGAEWVGIR